ncbi:MULTISPECIES: N-acetylmuramoyl-L-alanine amidase [unclassified Thermoactinomyces]|uniref:N-acetylmuramoyl-L-alanine amidase family protein n=1 Tax=unclassified Thermoactinomyces TaxID=2634588 RepID=UPI0018DD51F8|nr:N-acetylmuramoyl-L-alanine amidase [Thermoactinomyces sp. CICC 10523]MBH8602753.1 N-acetylmuramoyl-L-alanine amidase [Thermoactinomyces sp. CICC 10522]MBH8606138.1 N-acetylmuramoyl-L-alanine amidase [Thermoactinomyces sp. CICC 10521]
MVIDPGHGGKDSGATGFGLNEKDVVLELSKKINDHFGKYQDVTVSLTRWDDRFIELNERADFANKRNCDLFISIHNNSASPSANGFESYIHPNASSSTVRYQDEIHKHIMQYLTQYQIHDRGKKQANFAVLRETSMPAILLENLFISNQRENELLRDSSFLDGLANAIVEGVASVFQLRKKPAMYRITVDGQAVYDTAYESKIVDAVLEAVRKHAQEIQLKKL